MDKLLSVAAKELGRKGGKATSKKLGKAHYIKIQKLAAEKRRANKAVEKSLDKVTSAC